jgi:hypothetical protein
MQKLGEYFFLLLGISITIFPLVQPREANAVQSFKGPVHTIYTLVSGDNVNTP